jgi:hypothetical protein
MIADRMKSMLPLATGTAMIMTFVGVTGAQAATAPIKEVQAGYFGAKVNKTTGGNVCLVSEACQPAEASSVVGGFKNSDGVAGAPNGNVYVADSGNHRVQELEANGEFVLMFGREVNETAHSEGRTTEENVCPAPAHPLDKCKAGVEGGAPGQFGEGQGSVTVDPVSGAVYVTDRVKANLGGKTTNGVRVQKFTAEGVWVWEIGKEVITSGGNLCTAAEVAKCTGPAQYEFGAEPLGNSTEPGVFPIENSHAAAVGGPEDLLYVYAGQRVQEFRADGSYKGEISLAGTAGEMALDDSCQLHKPALTESTSPTCKAFDPEYGDVYVVYNSAANVIHKFTPDGVEVNAHFPLTLAPRDSTAGFFAVRGIALDPSGRLAVSEQEEVKSTQIPFGSLHDGGTGHLITEFATPGVYGVSGMAFNGEDELYVTPIARHEVVAYHPVPVAELLTRAVLCKAGAELEKDVTKSCTLNGEVDPWGVKETEVWFEWGRTPALGENTPPEPVPNEQPIEGVEEVPKPPCSAHEGEHKVRHEAKCPEAEINGVRPNQLIYRRLAGYDHNVPPSSKELLTSETTSFTTPMVPPRIVGEPSTPFVRSSSAVMFGELNPENAPTEYFFEYGTKLAVYCEGALRTKALESAAYRKIGTTLEATGLQFATTYQYRLCAIDKAGRAVDEHGGSKIKESTFTTLAAPAPQATTGLPSAIATTSATVSGSVNPDGQPATYEFEAGLYNGASTQYGVVFSGPAGAGIVPIEKTLVLTGLQPGTTYAYRITVASGYGTAYGAAVTFTTAGLPSVLPVSPVLEQLPVPIFLFPKEPAKVTPKKLTRAQQLARALKACAKKPKSKRAACRRSAHKKYAVSKKARKTSLHGKRSHGKGAQRKR